MYQGDSKPEAHKLDLKVDLPHPKQENGLCSKGALFQAGHSVDDQQDDLDKLMKVCISDY